jgi:hypothetical protein
MSCLIYSESRDIPIDFWNYNDFSRNNDHEFVVIDNIQSNIINKRVGNGVFVKINNEIYILTCFHIVENNNMEIKIYYYDINDNLYSGNAKIKLKIEDFDILLLSLNNPPSIDPNIIIDENNIFTINNFDFSNINITKYIEYFCFDTNMENLSKKKIECDYNKIVYEKLFSSILMDHEIPMINLVLKSMEHIPIEGISGSVAFYDTKPIGLAIIGYYENNNSNIEILPFSFIFGIIKGTFNKKIPSSIIFKYNVYSVEFDDNVKYSNKNIENLFNMKFYNGLVISDQFDVKILNSRKNQFKFLKNDIILNIDGHFINNDNKIYNDIFGCSINIGTYFLTQHYCSDMITIYYMRNDMIYSIIVKCTSINDSIQYHLNKSPSFLYNDGLVFTELSGKLVDYFRKNNIESHGNLNNVKIDKIQKYVVLVHINYDYIQREYPKGYEELKKNNFPFINKKFSILNKIGNEIVTDIISLRKILTKKKRERQTTCNYNTFTSNENTLTINLESKSKDYVLNFKY